MVSGEIFPPSHAIYIPMSWVAACVCVWSTDTVILDICLHKAVFLKCIHDENLFTIFRGLTSFPKWNLVVCSPKPICIYMDITYEVKSLIQERLLNVRLLFKHMPKISMLCVYTLFWMRGALKNRLVFWNQNLDWNVIAWITCCLQGWQQKGNKNHSLTNNTSMYCTHCI